MMSLLKRVLRQLGLLEGVRRFKSRGIRAPIQDLRYRIFGAPDGLPISPDGLTGLLRAA